MFDVGKPRKWRKPIAVEKPACLYVVGKEIWGPFYKISSTNCEKQKPQKM